MSDHRDYLRAFDGIPSFPGAQRSLSAVLRSRRAVREDRDNGGVEVSVGALKAIAERIEAQSRALVEAQGGWGEALTEDDLSSFQRSLARSGTLIRVPGAATENPEGETPTYEALYDEKGRLVGHNGGDLERSADLTEGWNYTRFAVSDRLFKDDAVWPRDLTTVLRFAAEASDA